ncbi:unnamed protein product, partial [Polarella glacialis]
DSWFIFDSCLVFESVLETWAMALIALAIGAPIAFDASILRLVRLLRLMRMMRMAKLLRAMPELMILIKGMAAATRSVIFTLILLVLVMYVFAIAFTQLTAGTPNGDRFFATVADSMYTLMVYGTLLDGIGSLLDALGQDSLAIASAFVVFVLIAALTLMNMLIGVLCEVVSGVAAVEKEELAVSFVKGKLQNIVMGFDTNGDNLISKSEFEMLMKSKEAVKALTEVGVDAEGLVDLAETIFSENYGNGSDCYDKELSFPDFMEVILELRGGNTATIRDLVNLKKFMSKMSGESTTLTNSRL